MGLANRFYTDAEKKALVDKIKKDIASGVRIMTAVKAAGVAYWTYRTWEAAQSGKKMPASHLKNSGGRAYVKK